MRLNELVDSVDVPATRVAEGAWDVAARRVRRRRLGAAASAAATAVAVVAVVASTAPGAGPDEHAPPAATPTASPSSDGPRIVTPQMASPRVYDNETLKRLQQDPLTPPSDAPALSDSPVPYAKLAMTPTSESTDVFLLGPDDEWRRLDLALEQVSDGTYVGSPFGPTALSPDATHLALPQPFGLIVVDLTDGTHRRYPVPARYLTYANWLSDSRVVASTEASSAGWEVDLATGEVSESTFGPSTGWAPDGSLVTWGMGDDGFTTQLAWDDGTVVSSEYNNTADLHPFPPLVGDDVVVGHHTTVRSGVGLPMNQNAMVVIDRATGDPLGYLPTNRQKGDLTSLLGWREGRVVIGLPTGNDADADRAVVVAAWDWEQKTLEPLITVTGWQVAWGRGS